MPDTLSLPRPLPTEDQELWSVLRAQAWKLSRREPVLAPTMHALVLAHDDFAGMLAHLIANRLASPPLTAPTLAATLRGCLADAPQLLAHARRDVQAALESDPAARDLLNLCLNQKGFLALQAHRLAHQLWCSGREALALHLQGRVAAVLGLDIHPAARIGSGVFIDHGTGVVIGETAVVGDDVTLFQDVTLGGTGKERGDRHPKVDAGAVIYAGARVLGNIRIGAGARVGASSVVLEDVAPHTTVVGVPAAPVLPHAHAA